MYFGKTNPCHDYKMHNSSETNVIMKGSEEKDLGVIFDDKLNFDKHIYSAVSKANQKIGIIKRTFSSLDKDTFLYLYKGLVRPHLEYGNCIWYPRLKRQSVVIEKVQRRATKLVQGLQNVPYSQRLKELNLPTLKARRIRGDLIQAFKIFNNIDDLHVQDLFILSEYDKTRNSTDKIFIQFSRTNARKMFFTNRVAPLWNRLPSNIKRAQDTNTFKNLLDEWKDYKSVLYNYDE